MREGIPSKFGKSIMEQMKSKVKQLEKLAKEQGKTSAGVREYITDLN